MTETENEHPAGPDASFGRRALSTRGYVAAAVIPLLVAAGLFGLVVWNYDDADVQGTTAPLLVSSFKPGQPAGEEQISGVLEKGEDDCPVLVTPEAEIALAWPAGYAARVSPGGTLTVYDPDQEEVVRADQELRATGTLSDVAGSPYVGRPCAPATGQVAEIQSEIQVLG